MLWSLPLYRWWPRRVHVAACSADRRSGADILRHEGALPDADVTERFGLSCTTLDRTLFDVARLASEEAAVAAADAGLQLVAESPRRYEPDAAEAWRDGMAERLAVRGARGIRQARRVVAFADGRADRPGESVSRLQLARLGFRDIRLQVPVPGPDGELGVDFGLPEVGVLGEYDGEGKYADPAMRGGRTAEEVLMREKRREDWIRGVTRAGFVRWGSSDILTSDALGARLRAFGIRPPRR